MSIRRPVRRAPDGRSGPPCRWPATAGSRSRRPWPCRCSSSSRTSPPAAQDAFWIRTRRGRPRRAPRRYARRRSSFGDHAHPRPRAPTGAAPGRRWVVRPHGDLGAVTRLAGSRPDLHHGRRRSRDLELEEPLDQPGWVAAHDDLGALGGLADLDDVRLEASAVFGRARTGPARPGAAVPPPCPGRARV